MKNSLDDPKRYGKPLYPRSVTNAMLAVAPDGTVKSNISGGPASPQDNTLSDVLDDAVGGIQGAVIFRSATGWVRLDPGAAGYVLTAHGIFADPTWAYLPPGQTGPVGPQAPITAGSFVEDITHGKVARSGRFTVRPEVPFSQEQIGGPVIVQTQSGPVPGRGTAGDDCEWDPISCSGEIESPSVLTVRWASRTLVRGARRFTYLVPS